MNTIYNSLGSIYDALQSFLFWAIAHIPQIFIGAVILAIIWAIQDQKEQDRILYKPTDYFLFVITIINGYIAIQNYWPQDIVFLLIILILPPIIALSIGGFVHAQFQCKMIIEMVWVLLSFIGACSLTLLLQTLFTQVTSLAIAIAIFVGVVLFFKKFLF